MEDAWETGPILDQASSRPCPSPPAQSQQRDRSHESHGDESFISLVLKGLWDEQEGPLAAPEREELSLVSLGAEDLSYMSKEKEVEQKAGLTMHTA